MIRNVVFCDIRLTESKSVFWTIDLVKPYAVVLPSAGHFIGFMTLLWGVYLVLVDLHLGPGCSLTYSFNRFRKFALHVQEVFINYI